MKNESGRRGCDEMQVELNEEGWPMVWDLLTCEPIDCSEVFFRTCFDSKHYSAEIWYWISEMHVIHTKFLKLVIVTSNAADKLARIKGW